MSEVKSLSKNYRIRDILKYCNLDFNLSLNREDKQTVTIYLN